MGTYIDTGVRVIEETIFGRGSMGQMHAKLELKGLSKHVSARMPESLAAFVVWELEQFDFAISL